MAGKLGRRGVVSAVRPGRLFFITDSSSNRRYLVETGSAFSLMPWRSLSPPSGPGLSRADGLRIPCWGEQPFTVTIGGLPRQWTFLLAAVSFPILGIDFLRHHSLVVDMANNQLSSPLPSVSTIVPGRSYADAARLPPAGTPQSPSGSSTAKVPPEAASPPLATSEWLAAMQRQFPQVFFQDAAASSLVPPQREARDPDGWPAGHRQIPAAGSHAVGCRQERVPDQARLGHNSPLFQPMD